MDELELLEDLVREYSPSGSERAAVREFVRIARTFGYATRIDSVGNGIASVGSGRPRIVYLGHIDTVDGEIPVHRKGGWLYGRGVVDAKGPLLSALLAGEGFAPPGEFRVVAAVGEEVDSRGARHFLRGPRPDALIAGEPSGWDGVSIGYKGMVRLSATFRGNRTHYSSPTPTAFDRAVDWVALLRGFAATRSGPSPFRSLALKVVGLEGRIDRGHETARITLDLRLPPGLTAKDVVRSIPREPHGASLEVEERIDPVEVRRENPVVEGLLAGIRAAGGRPTLWRKGGTSDLNLAVRSWGVPAAAYGPGDARLDHTDRERLSRAELRRSVTVLKTALERIRAAVPTPRRPADGV